MLLRSRSYDVMLGKETLACRLQDSSGLCEQVKFFVGKPLIASNGYHMGTL